MAYQYIANSIVKCKLYRNRPIFGVSKVVPFIWFSKIALIQPLSFLPGEYFTVRDVVENNIPCLHELRYVPEYWDY